MNDREKLINLIMQRFVLKISPETEYKIIINFNIEELVDHLISHGVTVKAMQRPLSLEELKRMEVGPVWCETKTTKTPCVVKNSMIDNEDAIFYALGSEYPIFFNVDVYGQFWRCWAEKPTEAERKAAAWL